MDNAKVDHECEAVHCVTCCPVHRAYTEGWEYGKSWHNDISVMDKVRSTHLEELVLSILFIVVLIFIAKEIHDRADATS